jgi:hypothetical protein
MPILKKHLGRQDANWSEISFWHLVDQCRFFPLMNTLVPSYILADFWMMSL